MRLASYNVENLFERAVALNTPDWGQSRDILKAQADVNALFRKPAYSAADRRRMQELLTVLGLGKSDESDVAILRENRGRLRSGRPLAVTAKGPEDWIGWVDLTTEPVNAVAIDNTARIMALLKADLLAVVEAEDRPAPLRFSERVIPTVDMGRRDPSEFDRRPYDAVMLVDGNDSRGIDVGLMARKPLAIRSVTSHVDDRDGAGARIFSRDCPEYAVALPNGRTLWLLVNHFKSKGFGSPKASDARRLAQARRAREIYEARIASGAEFVAILGDLNDTPDSAPLAPLFEDGALQDVSRHPNFVSDGRPGTWKNGAKANKLDYIILSPALAGRVKAAGVERRGVWGGARGDLFPHLEEITAEPEAASDHAAIWVDLDLG